MREAERVWVMRAGRKAREERGREGGVGGMTSREEDEKLKGGKGGEECAAGKGREERQGGRKGGRKGRTESQHPMTDVEDEDEDEDEEEDEGKKRTAAVLTFVMDSDERRKGLCLDLFEELMDLAQVRWAGRV